MRIISLIAMFSVIAMVTACKPASFDEQVAKAEAHLGSGNAKAALSDYQSIAKKFKDDDRSAEVLLRIADLYSTVLNDPASAIRMCGEVIKKNPLSGVSRIARERRAALLMQKGDYEAAILDYSELLKYFGADKDVYRYRVLLAGAHISDRNYRQARVEIKPLVEGKGIPADVREQAVFIAAESFFLEGKTDRAAEFYQWFLNDFPKSALAAEAKLHLATCLEDMGYLGMAREVTRSAAGQYPNKKVVTARMKSLDERGGPLPKARNEKIKSNKSKRSH